MPPPAHITASNDSTSKFRVQGLVSRVWLPPPAHITARSRAQSIPLLILLLLLIIIIILIDINTGNTPRSAHHWVVRIKTAYDQVPICCILGRFLRNLLPTHWF